MSRKFALVVSISMISALLAMQVPAEDAGQNGAGKSERKSERTGNQPGEELRKEWGVLQGAIEKMDLKGRVYSRLYWDQSLNDATLDIEVRTDNVVVLKGSVSSALAKRTAVQLARDTTGVKGVVDHLAIAEGGG